MDVKNTPAKRFKITAQWHNARFCAFKNPRSPKNVEKSCVKYFSNNYSRENSASLIFDPEKLEELASEGNFIWSPPPTLTHFLPFYWDIHWWCRQRAEGQQ